MPRDPRGPLTLPPHVRRSPSPHVLIGTCRAWLRWLSCLALLAALFPARDICGQVQPAKRTPSVEERLERLERSNRILQAKLREALEGRPEFELLQSQDEPEDIRTDEGSDDAMPSTPATEDSDTTEGTSRSRSSYDDQPEDIRTDEPEKPTKSKPTESSFADGFRWETKDGQFRLVFHNETQLDFRAYTQSGSDPTNQFNFSVPRMRFYFNGNLTEPIEYSVSINKGYGSLDLLDAYLNFRFHKSLQVRTGRYRVPFTYDWYALSNQFLTTPERSIFAANYGYNRNYAVMLHGEILDDSAEYAIAVANGPRNQYVDFNGGKDLLGFLNVRPFMHAEELPQLKHLNIGGSFAYGQQSQDAVPVDFRTSVNATEAEGAIEVAPSFLQLNPGVMERGLRSLWEVHLAYFYKQLTLTTAWDAGFNTYTLNANSPEIRVPTHGYHVALGYFLTGEEITRRTMVDVKRPFKVGKGETGPGAIELQCRYSAFTVGEDIFTGGLADANLWTNRVYAVDAGVNWYINTYVKIYFDWQHSVYSDPVQYRPGDFRTRATCSGSGRRSTSESRLARLSGMR